MKTDTFQQPDLLSVAQLSQRLGFGKTKTYRLLNSGELPFRRIRLGEQWRFSRLEVERFCHDQLAGNQTVDAGDDDTTH